MGKPNMRFCQFNGLLSGTSESRPIRQQRMKRSYKNKLLFSHINRLRQGLILLYSLNCPYDDEKMAFLYLASNALFAPFPPTNIKKRHDPTEPRRFLWMKVSNLPQKAETTPSEKRGFLCLRSWVNSMTRRMFLAARWLKLRVMV